MKQVFDKELDTISVPKEKLANTRLQAQRKLAQQRQRKKEWSYRGVFAIVCLCLLASLALPPQKIEQDDLRLSSGYQLINASATDGEVKLTIHTVLADAYGMKIAYTLEAPFSLEQYRLANVELMQNGDILPASWTYDWQHNEQEIRGELDFYVGETKLNSREPFTLNMTLAGQPSATFHVSFTLPNEFEREQQYVLNQTVVVNEQKFTVREVIATPARTLVRIEADEHNSEQILSFDDITLRDDRQGEIPWPQNGMTGSGSMTEGVATYIFSSIYAHETTTLTLEIENMHALPKDHHYVEVDFEQQRPVTVPDWMTMEMTVDRASVMIKGEGVQLSYAIDAAGKRFEMDSQTSDSERSITTYKTQNMINPVKLYFYEYPRTIPFKRTIPVF